MEWITYSFANFNGNWSHRTLYDWCDYLSMQGLKLITMLMMGDPRLLFWLMSSFFAAPAHRQTQWWPSLCPMGLLPDTQSCRLHMWLWMLETGNVFLTTNEGRKVWRENGPGISGACATRNFTYLARGPFRYGPDAWNAQTILSKVVIYVYIYIYKYICAYAYAYAICNLYMYM